MRNISKNVGESYLVNVDLQIGTRVTQMPYRLKLYFHCLLILHPFIDVEV